MRSDVRAAWRQEHCGRRRTRRSSINDLVRAFAQFGKISRVPMLWVYALNDHYFGPGLAAQFYRA
jgi:hypothetical protein